MQAIFGYIQEQFFAAGSLVKDGAAVYCSECFIIPENDGKSLQVYGYLGEHAANTKIELKYKDEDGKYATFTESFIKFEIVVETIEKEYQGKKSKKEPTPVSKFIGEYLKKNCELGEGKFFSLYCDFGAPEAYITAVTTGKTEKGKPVNEDLIQEFLSEIVEVESISESENLKDVKPSKGFTARKGLSPQELLNGKLEGLTSVLSDETKSAQVADIVVWIAAQPDPQTSLAVITALLQ